MAQNPQISSIFYYFESISNLANGRALGRKIGVMQEVLLRKYLMKSPTISSRLFIERSLHGFSRAWYISSPRRVPACGRGLAPSCRGFSMRQNPPAKPTPLDHYQVVIDLLLRLPVGYDDEAEDFPTPKFVEAADRAKQWQRPRQNDAAKAPPPRARRVRKGPHFRGHRNRFERQVGLNLFIVLSRDTL